MNQRLIATVSGNSFLVATLLGSILTSAVTSRFAQSDTLTAPNPFAVNGGVELTHSSDRLTFNALVRVKARAAELEGGQFFPFEIELSYNPANGSVDGIRGHASFFEAPGRIIQALPSTSVEVISVFVLKDSSLGIEHEVEVYLIGLKYETASLRCEDRYGRTLEGHYTARHCRDIEEKQFYEMQDTGKSLDQLGLISPFAQKTVRTFAEFAGHLFGLGALQMQGGSGVAQFDFARLRAAFGMDVSLGSGRDSLRFTFIDAEATGGYAGLGYESDAGPFRSGPFALGSLSAGASLNVGIFQLGVAGGSRFIAWSDNDQGEGNEHSFFGMLTLGLNFSAGESNQVRFH